MINAQAIWAMRLASAYSKAKRAFSSAVTSGAPSQGRRGITHGPIVPADGVGVLFEGFERVPHANRGEVLLPLGRALGETGPGRSGVNSPMLPMLGILA